MLKIFWNIAFLSLLLNLDSQAQDSAPLLRFPTLSPDGAQIAFAYQGDIWTAPIEGGTANRITIHEAYERTPRWSPDGSRIVFSSNRYGNYDVFTIDADGQNLQRLTYHSGSDESASWITDDEILFCTARNYIQVEREDEFYTISTNGNTPYRSHDAVGLNGRYSADGELMAFVRGNCKLAREAYRGPANRDVWIFNASKETYSKLTMDEGQDVMPTWGADYNLYFLSARDGRYNIYRWELDQNGISLGLPIAITNYKDEGIDYFDISRDGSQIIYSHSGKLYTLDSAAEASPVHVSVHVGSDYRFDPEEFKTYTKEASEFSLSPDEEHIAFTVRGEVYIKQNDEDKSRAVQPAPHTAREKNTEWLNDSTLLFLSDRGGDYDLYTVNAAEDEAIMDSYEWEVEQILNTPEDESYFKISPDKSQIAIVAVTGQLSIIDVDTMGVMSTPRMISSGWCTPYDLTWSPDSKWIAYSQEDLDFNEEVFIRKSDGTGEPANISMHPRGDDVPVWSPDGSKLGFRSIRNNGDADIWFVWLTKEDWERTLSDWDEKGEEESKDKDKDDDEKEDLVIDLEDIHERVVQVTSMTGGEADLQISADGEEFYFSVNNGTRTASRGKVELKKVKWNGEDLEQVLADGNISGLQFDKKGKNIYYLKRGGAITKASKDGKSPKTLGFNAKMTIDHKLERGQIFEEAWRTLRDRFYDPDFHGEDWSALHDTYKARALNASTRQDFMYYCNLMLGQLNSSHMGLFGSGDEDTQKQRTGRLGLEFKPVGQGVEITRVVQNSPGDKKQSKLEVGEIVTAVNGKAIGASNVYALLNEKVDERIQLTVQSPSGARKVVIRPSSSTRNLLYEEWVDNNEKLVEEHSGGRLGYIHIRGMNWSSFESFERELMASGYNKEGVVIDVRYNGGGWTTDMVMAVLNVRQHAYTVPRGASDDLKKNHTKFKEHYPYGERLPLSAWTKPSIAVCNQNSYSNAEIFSHAFKTLGHGALVGMPTFGAVISTGGKGLQDGFFVRVPFRGWYVKATESNMEHGPAVPDYIVENAPTEKAEGKDSQLQKSVDVLLGQIDRE
ncbi:MAG: tricorn protease [Saprospiraceae bacterium]|jgi:tricorn protease